MEEKGNEFWVRKVIIPCLIIIIGVTLGYYFDNQLLVKISLLILSVFFLFNNMKNAFYILLVFIPFNNILKFSPESFAFLSILSMEFIVIAIFETSRYKYKVKGLLLIQVLFLLILSLITFKINLGNLVEFTGNFITLINLMFLCAVVGKIDYKKASISYVFGFLCASISGLIIGKLPQMDLLINNFAASRELNTIFRFTGVDQDANYFGFYALFAIGLLIMLNHEKTNKFTIAFIFLVTLILGFFSYSKMFMLIFLIVFILLLISSIKNVLKNMKNLQYLVIYSSLLILCYISFKPIIDNYLINPYLDRFIYSIDGGELSNGRIEIFWLYGKEIMSDIKIIAIGTGFFRDNQELTLASHNTYITIIYTFGIIGTLALITFYGEISKQIKYAFQSTRNNRILFNKEHRLFKFYPLLIMLLTMFTLDLLYMRFFPYLLFLSLLIIHENITRAE